MSETEVHTDRPPARLTCPKCGKDMLEDASSGDVFHCLLCEGVWQRRGQLEQFLRESASARGVVLDALGLMESQPKPTSIKCPDCSAQYLECLRYRGVEVERCRSCHGVYADATEREKIAERVLKARDGWASALREWEALGAAQRTERERARNESDEAGYLGMALANVTIRLR